MKNILIVGAGRSSSSLIDYLLKKGSEERWLITIADSDEETAKRKIESYKNAKAVFVDVFDSDSRENLIAAADLVVSMLPAHLHPILANECLKFRNHFLTASYVSPEMELLRDKAREAKLVFLNECGLDPGIDHMTAMKAINEIRKKGGKLLSFKSYTGGLIAPESDDNPWHYKFTWNPRNVVLAGQGSAAKFIMKGQYKYIPYHKLFSRYEAIDIDGLGTFEGYPNRDSLNYRTVYGLEGIPTMIRGTLRNRGFCDSWDVFVQLGMTDDTYKIENSEMMSHREFTNSFLKYNVVEKVEDKLCRYLNINHDSDIFHRLHWLGLFSDLPLGVKNASPAAILQSILEKKWALKQGDKDMVVMQHLIEYELGGKTFELKSSIISKGNDEIQTAMSKTVGWPLAIATKMILNGQIQERGVLVPTTQDIYMPILDELKEMGIEFIEEEREIE